MGRPLGKTAPADGDDGNASRVTTYSYIGRETRIHVCGNLGGTCLDMSRSQDSLGRFVRTVDAQGGITRTWADGSGNVVALQDVAGSTIRATYNALGQRMSVVDPNQGNSSFAYNALGEVLSSADGRGVTTSNSYDKLGRLISRSASVDVDGNGSADSVQDVWSYDPLDPVSAPGALDFSERTIAGVLERREQHGREAPDTHESEISYTPMRQALTDGPLRQRHAVAMTYPRNQLVPPGSPGTYHCVSRCVRRAFLCGEDRYSGQSFEHRRQWIEDRLHQLSEVFAISLWAYAVMSNHLHVVVQVLPEVVAQWSDAEVAQRWVCLFPKAEQDTALRIQALLADSERLAVLRARLSDLSWFMRCLSEPIARRANAEDHCKGRFWEGRFKCQALLDESAVLAAMAYVDLNPVRAALCETLEDSAHTSARRRLVQHKTEAATGEVIAPVAGVGGQCVLGITATDYLQLLDWTGRLVHPNKRGTLNGPPPRALQRMGHDAALWPRQVLAVGSDFHRAVGAAENLIAKAAAMGQRWLHGIGAARRLLRASR